MRLEHSGDGVATVTIARPDKMNALNLPAWRQLRDSILEVNQTDARVCILRGEGACFSAGMDLKEFLGLQKRLGEHPCEGRKREWLRGFIIELQDIVTCLERCRVPVIAAVHGLALGGAVHLITTADMCYVTDNAKLSMKEVDLGIAPDIGGVQRLSGLVGERLARELALTARTFSGTEAAQMGLANRALADEAALQECVMKVAKTIAAKSPLAIRGTKEQLLLARDRPIADAQHMIALQNSAQLLSADFSESVAAAIEKRPPLYKFT